MLFKIMHPTKGKIGICWASGCVETVISYQFLCGIPVPPLESFNTGLLALTVQVAFDGDVVQGLLRVPCSLVTYIWHCSTTEENHQSPCYCLPAIAVGEAVGALEIDLWASGMGCSDGRKKALIKDISFSSLLCACRISAHLPCHSWTVMWRAQTKMLLAR